jgi:hypothetical protein
MNPNGNHLFAPCRGRVRSCNSSQSKIMTLNLYARKKLFQVSSLCKRYADKSARRGYDTRAKILLCAWEKLLDMRDKLR